MSEIHRAQRKHPQERSPLNGRATRKPLLAAGATAIIVAVGVGFSGIAAQAAPTAAAQTSTFDNNLNGWQGGRNIKLETDRVNSVQPTIAGHTYEATAWVRVEKPNNAVSLRILEEDAQHGVIDSNQIFQWRTDTEWKQITTRYTAQRGSSSLTAQVFGSKLQPDNSVIVGSVALTDVSAGAKTPAVSEQRTAPASSGWRLAWSDEFNGDSLNRAAWNVENNSTYGDGNQELACLMDRPENVNVADGMLTITARTEASPIDCGSKDSRFPDGRLYTSGMVTTKKKVDFEYGRFEIRAKTPLAQGTSKGLWPAFWLRPSAGALGEIDVLEAIGTAKNDPFRANRVVQTIHYDYVPTFSQQGTDYDMPAGTSADGFHDYAVEWEPGSITWFVDGLKTYARNTSTTSWIDEAFVNKFFMRLNLAVGGNWPGSPDADTAFPAMYQVDHVRVYQR